MKNKKRFLSIVMSLMMAISIFQLPSLPAKAESMSNLFNKASIINNYKKNIKDIDYQSALAQKYGIKGTNDNKVSTSTQTINPDDNVRVIVEVTGKPVSEITSGKSISISQKTTLEAQVDKTQKPVKDEVQKFGNIRHTYKNLFNGFSAVVKYKDIDTIREMSGVQNVSVATLYTPDINNATSLTNVPAVWNDLNYKGEGTVVAVVDTGIDVNHKDMKLSSSTTPKLTEATVKSLGGPGKYYTEKVPYGYNFADMNDTIIDTTSSMHGMHVSGIIGANATDEEVANNTGVKGVAPEAQLLAMKVFSNNPYFASAYNDDIAAAIEDSVKHEADVINMSLGSTAGYVNANDIVQKAIKNATDLGTVVVVSAGNSYYSTSSYYNPYSLDTDLGVVGEPGLCPDALEVASYENSKMILPAFDYNTGSASDLIGYTTSEVDPVGVFSGSYQLVDCGLGRVGKINDFAGKDLNGKIALIQRGVITFVEKKQNAQAAGAAGVIVYNNNNDDSYINMATDTSVTIPSIFISCTDGKKLLDNIGNVTVSFNNKIKVVANSNAGMMSDFTSWGTTPDLGFKPEVTAPGGQIYSTVNNNKYETMSGTSMAAPHTSGAEALVVQYLKKANPNLAGRSLVNMAKTLLTNSAEPQIDPNTDDAKLPYLARCEGAGLIKVDKAIKTKAYVTDENGNAAIALKEIGDSKVFNLVITNFGDKDLTFKVSDKYGVLTNIVDSGFIVPTAVKLDGAGLTFDNVNDNSEVTVLKGGSTIVKVTLNVPPADNNIFVEGFITLESSDNTTLGIPYIGFHGKWSGDNGPRMFDAPVWDTANSYFGETMLLDKEGYILGYEGRDDYNIPIVNTDHIAISTEGGIYTSVMPNVSFMRNAKEFKVQILNADKTQVIREISTDSNIAKNYTDRQTSYSKSDTKWAWDGTVYNQLTGEYNAVPDGQYYVRLLAKPDYSDAKDYTLDMPVKVDSSGPVFNASGEKLEGNQYKVNITNASDFTGIVGYDVYAITYNNQREPDAATLNGLVNEENYVGSISPDETEKTFTIPDGYNVVYVVGFDYAGNPSQKLLTIQQDTSVMFASIPYYTTSKNVTVNYTISDLVNPSVDHIGIVVDDGSEAANEKNLSYDLRDLADGLHKVTVKLYTSDGKNVGQNTIKFVVDTANPVITVNNENYDKDNSTIALSNGETEYNLDFNVSDNASGYEVMVNGTELDYKEVIDGTVISKKYEYPVNIVDGKATVNIDVIDGAGNETKKDISITSSINQPEIVIDQPDISGGNIASKTINVSGSVRCNADVAVSKILVNDQEAAMDASYKFTKDILFDSYGVNTVDVKAYGEDGTKVIAEKQFTVTLTPLKFNDPFSSKIYHTNNTDENTTIGYTIDKSDTNIKSLRITIDDKTPLSYDLNQDTVNVGKLAIGTHNVKFEVLDKDEKTIVADNVTIIVEKSLPVVEVIDSNGNDFTQGMLYKDSTVKVNIIPDKELKELKISVADAKNENIKDLADPAHNADGISYTADLTLLEGENRVTFTMTDLAGNINSYQAKCWVDTVPPELKVYGADNTTEIDDKANLNVTGDTYTFTIKASDDTFGYRLYANGEQIAADSNPDGLGTKEKAATYTYKIPDGISNVYFEAEDNAGNHISKTINVNNGKVFNSPLCDFDELTYDKAAQTNLNIPVIFNDDDVVRILRRVIQIIDGYRLNLGSSDLVADKDYIVDKNNGAIIISSDFLNSLDTGDYYFGINFKSGLFHPFTLHITDTRSKDAGLKVIQVGSNALSGFDSNKFNYVYEMSPFDTEVPQITADVFDTTTKYEIIQAKKIGDTATITVTAQDGTVKVYTVKFIVPLSIQKVNSNVTDDQAEVLFRATNISDNLKHVTLITAVYDENGKLINLVSGGYDIKSGESVDMSAKISIKGGKTVKCFIWDDFINMKPLSNVVVIK